MNRNVMDDLVMRAGGKFKFTVLVQKRLRELVKGSERLVTTDNRNLIDIVFKEIQEGKVGIAGPDGENIMAVKTLSEEKKSKKKAKAE